MDIINEKLNWKGEFNRKNVPEQLIIHHAEATNCTIGDIENWHQQQGWIGVGYHYFIRKDGTVYKGRPDNAEGAHCYGYNDKSLGICFEGDYTTENMPEAQKKSSIDLCKYLIDKYDISRIEPHRALYNTSCPGNKFPFDEIQNAVYEFQSCNGLDEDGLAGSQTFECLDSKFTSQMVNKAIKGIQRVCNELGVKDKNGNILTEDGILGDLTQSAIEKLPILKRGFTSVFVTWVQQRLVDLNFSCGPSGIDGSFGFCTLTAIQNFQASEGIVPTGLVDQCTLKKLLN